MTTSGHNVGLEEEKPMNDTPRTDVAWKTLPSVYDFIVEMKRMERELNAANQRIKQLEDRIHRAAMAFFEDVPDASVASGMLVILEEERGKKP